MATKIVIQQPQPLMYEMESTEWSTGICDCCEDIESCCLAFWCGPCFACKTVHEYGECLCLPLLDMFGFIPPIALTMRVVTRQRYGIKDTICHDCLYACCCYACSWCQVSREIKMRAKPVVLTHALPNVNAGNYNA
ncbi:cornifelin homolog B [Amia ocellicauda]|uniref:cornifelin homolog B n=1 Tax=Amia ocellicauda TaxID=2972642 RepID=UPI00346399A7